MNSPKFHLKLSHSVKFSKLLSMCREMAKKNAPRLGTEGRSVCCCEDLEYEVCRRVVQPNANVRKCDANQEDAVCSSYDFGCASVVNQVVCK